MMVFMDTLTLEIPWDIPPDATHKHGKWASKTLLQWYDNHKRDLPWRAKGRTGGRTGGRDTPNPYHVWLSEIMLQQTTVATVKDYYARFTEKWPTVEHLANANRDDVLAEWAGLGYYARARNLHACAEVIRDTYNGQFPKTEQELLTLPGVGAYTAAAIASIAFGRRAVVVDGNVERVVSRLFNYHGTLPKARPDIYKLTDVCTPNRRSGDLAQAFMDLGSTICRPKSPNCGVCPLAKRCMALSHSADTPATLPKKAPKKAKPIRTCYGYVITCGDHVLLERRPDTGLLGGMLGIPASRWDDAPLPPLGTLYPLSWDGNGENHTLLDIPIRHTFTHFHLDTHVVHVHIDGHMPNLETPYGWYKISDLEKLALPTVMVKPLKAIELLLLEH